MNPLPSRRFTHQRSINFGLGVGADWEQDPDLFRAGSVFARDGPVRQWIEETKRLHGSLYRRTLSVDDRLELLAGLGALG